MSEYLQLENRLLKLELRVVELEKQLAQQRGSTNGTTSSVSGSSSSNIVSPSIDLPDGVTPQSDEQVRNYQKVRDFIDLLAACR